MMNNVQRDTTMRIREASNERDDDAFSNPVVKKNLLTRTD